MATGTKSGRPILWTILLIIAIWNVMPFAWIVAGSFKPHLEIQKGRVWPWQWYEVPKEQKEGQEAQPTPEVPPTQIAETQATQEAPQTQPAETHPAEEIAQTQPTQPSGEGSEIKYVTTENYQKIFDKLSGLPTYYFNTVYLAAAGTFQSLLVGSLAA